MVTRRKFVIVLGVGALAAPLASFAKQQGRVWRIGLLRAAGCACATAVLVSLPQLVMAQGSFPDKPIRLIVPTAAGAGQDIVARLIAQKLNEALRQPVIVDNRPGANGVVATELVARAPADGSMIAVGNSGTHAINATLYRKLPYDPVRDFAAISEVVSSSPVMVASQRVAANSIRELIAEAKKAPGKFNIAVVGATGEIAGNALKAFPGLGTLGGGMLHAIAYGLVFDSLGHALSATLAEHSALDAADVETRVRALLAEPQRERVERVARLALESVRSKVRGGAD